MRLFHLLLLLLTPVWIFAQLKTNTPDVSVQALKADLDSLQSWIHHTHPKPFEHTDSVQVMKSWEVAVKSIREPMSRTAFANLVSPLVNQYNDGHMYIDLDMQGEEFESFKNNNGRFFPLTVKIIDSKLVVTGDLLHTNYIERGSVIESINGIAIDTILHALQVPADFKEGREAAIARLFGWLLWNTYRWDGKFVVGLKNNPIISKEITGILVDDYFDKMFSGDDWSLQLYPKEKLAIIECRNYRNIDNARMVLDSFFSIIRDQNIEHLAFDIRNNGGGNSAIGDIFLSYVTKEKFASFLSKSFRYSSAVQQLGEDNWMHGAIEKAKKEWKQQGEFYTTTAIPAAPPALKDASLFFKGRFFLLTGYQTYSSAHITALQVKCFQLGTIVGEPTGERPDLTGEVIELKLPNTGLILVCPTAKYTAPCSLPSITGVQPDYLVPSAIEDIKKGNDVVIEFVKKIVATNAD